MLLTLSNPSLEKVNKEQNRHQKGLGSFFFFFSRLDKGKEKRQRNVHSDAEIGELSAPTSQQEPGGGTRTGKRPGCIFVQVVRGSWSATRRWEESREP